MPVPLLKKEKIGEETGSVVEHGIKKLSARNSSDLSYIAQLNQQVGQYNTNDKERKGNKSSTTS